MTLPESRFALLRAQMVERQLRGRGIRDDRVLAAMGRLPRERFVPEAERARAYEDSALPIGLGQTISQPFMVARTLELCRLQGEERVLEIGGGSGYQAALLGILAAEIVSIERLLPLAERARLAVAAEGLRNVQILHDDGSVAMPGGSFDVIVVAAASPRFAKAWLDQLRPGGRIVAPIGDRSLQILSVLTRGFDGEDRIERAEACVFVPLIGESGLLSES